jgi:putative transposase
MYAFIEEHRYAFGVEPICRVLPIASATYYARAAITRNPDQAQIVPRVIWLTPKK